MTSAPLTQTEPATFSAEFVATWLPEDMAADDDAAAFDHALDAEFERDAQERDVEQAAWGRA